VAIALHVALWVPIAFRRLAGFPSANADECPGTLVGAPGRAGPPGGMPPQLPPRPHQKTMQVAVDAPRTRPAGQSQGQARRTSPFRGRIRRFWVRSCAGGSASCTHRSSPISPVSTSSGGCWPSSSPRSARPRTRLRCRIPGLRPPRARNAVTRRLGRRAVPGPGHDGVRFARYGDLVDAAAYALSPAPGLASPLDPRPGDVSIRHTLGLTVLW